MIKLIATDTNKLFIFKNGNRECKPWGITTFGTQVTISSLIDKESTYQGDFSDFTGPDDVPFGDLESLIEYVTPCLGFKPAAGGSAAPVYSSSALLKTGQTVSYVSGDDGTFQTGRDSNFLTLTEINVFGTLNRFTDSLGGSGYSNNIVLDHSIYDGNSILGYYRVLMAIEIWPNQFPIIDALNIDGFTNWRMTNIRELTNLVDYSLTNVLSYPPFSLAEQAAIQSSTTAPTNTANCFAIGSSTLNNGGILLLPKTSPRPAMVCRNFTLSELGL